MKAWIRPPNSTWMKDAPEGVLYSPPRGAVGTDGPPQPAALSATGYRPVQDILAKYNPGVEGQEFATGNAAKFIAAGSDIVFEVHYTATGKPENGSIVGRHRARRRAAGAAPSDDHRDQRARFRDSRRRPRTTKSGERRS